MSKRWARGLWTRTARRQMASLMRYQLYRPPTRKSTNTSGSHTTQPSPEPALVVMLHDCGRDARSFVAKR